MVDLGGPCILKTASSGTLSVIEVRLSPSAPQEVIKQLRALVVAPPKKEGRIIEAKIAIDAGVSVLASANTFFFGRRATETRAERRASDQQRVFLVTTEGWRRNDLLCRLDGRRYPHISCVATALHQRHQRKGLGIDCALWTPNGKGNQNS